VRISFKHKFIWISKPKTGSSSFRQLLDPFSDICSTNAFPFRHHATLNELHAVFQKECWNFTSFYKVVAARNPWELLVSLYCYSKTDTNGIHKWQTFQGYQSDRLMPFKDWIRKPANHEWFRTNHALDRYILSDEQENMADFIFASDKDVTPFFEGIQKHCQLKLDPNGLNRLNVTTKATDLLDAVKLEFNSQEIDDLIGDIFSTEITLFNYKNSYQ